MFLIDTKPAFFRSSHLLSTRRARRNLDKKTAVIKLVKIDRISIVANPLTELVPKIKSTTAAIMVVIFASKIVANDRLFPERKAERTDFPSLSSSLIRS